VVSLVSLCFFTPSSSTEMVLLVASRVILNPTGIHPCLSPLLR
jgi:hypothetical protein